MIAGCSAGDATVIVDANVPCSQWERARAELRRERVVIHMRGSVGDFRQSPVAMTSNGPPPKPSRVTTAHCE